MTQVSCVPCSITDFVGGAARNGTGAGALSRITAETMADGAAHDGSFLYASSGLPGLLQNG
jgi:hypothetical protein